MSSTNREAMPKQELSAKRLRPEMIQGPLREDQTFLLQQADSVEQLLSTLEKLGRETPINLTNTEDTVGMRFKGARVYLRHSGEWYEQTTPISPVSLKNTIFWDLLEKALSGEGTICAGI